MGSQPFQEVERETGSLPQILVSKPRFRRVDEAGSLALSCSYDTE